MGKEANLAFAAYLLRGISGGLAKEEFYREAEKVGWIVDGARREWVRKYIDPLFDGTGEKELFFFFDGQRLRLEKTDLYISGFAPIDIHNTLTQRSPEMLKQVRERGRIYNFLDLMVAMADEYEKRTGKTLYQLALEEHAKNKFRPRPRDPNISPHAKYYEIEVDVRIGRISHDIPRSVRIVERMIRETRDRIPRHRPDGDSAKKVKEELARWDVIHEKFGEVVSVLEGDNPRRYTLELTSMNGPPIDDAMRNALREAIRGLSTTEEEDALLAKINRKGIKVDESSSTAEVKGVVNLTKRWIDEEIRLFGGHG